ncbi:MAG: response regulator transcription factor [Bacteroidales bacterium]|nr:response regulator transcription factor [Bacteroidales bacterium]
MKINCLVVDDEQYARKLLTGYVEKIPHLVLTGEAKNAMEAMQILQESHVDLMFLDIQMPDLTGLELMKSLHNRPVVIFTTAYKEYAIDGYQLDVIDYMLKPISFERFVQGINKAAEMIRLRSLKEDPEPPLAKTEGKKPTFITLKADYKIYKVKLDEILFIEGLKEYVTYYTTQRKFIILESLQKLEQSLPSQFLRVHKSYIVNTDHIDALYGNQIELGKTRIPIGKTYIDKVKGKLFG